MSLLASTTHTSTANTNVLQIRRTCGNPCSASAWYSSERPLAYPQFTCKLSDSVDPKLIGQGYPVLSCRQYSDGAGKETCATTQGDLGNVQTLEIDCQPTKPPTAARQRTSVDPSATRVHAIHTPGHNPFHLHTSVLVWLVQQQHVMWPCLVVPALSTCPIYLSLCLSSGCVENDNRAVGRITITPAHVPPPTRSHSPLHTTVSWKRTAVAEAILCVRGSHAACLRGACGCRGMVQRWSW